MMDAPLWERDVYFVGSCPLDRGAVHNSLPLPPSTLRKARSSPRPSHKARSSLRPNRKARSSLRPSHHLPSHPRYRNRCRTVFQDRRVPRQPSRAP